MDNITSHPLMKDIPDETIVRYVVEFIRVMGCPYLMDERTVDIEIDDHRGALPCDFFEEVSVRGEHGEPFVTASGTFGECDTPSYRIQGGVIHTSIPCGVVQLSYRAIEEDEDGYPLIPDDSIALRAMEAYVKKQWFTVLHDLGKINVSILLNAKQDTLGAQASATATSTRSASTIWRPSAGLYPPSTNAPTSTCASSRDCPHPRRGGSTDGCNSL